MQKQEFQVIFMCNEIFGFFQLFKNVQVSLTL